MEIPTYNWIYHQIAEKSLKPNVLNLEELWGWLDISVRLDWKSGDPMYDPNIDKVLADLLVELRAKGANGGIAITDYTRHLDRKSLYGISADETKNVYPILAKILGAKRKEVRDLKAAEFNFIGNWLYPHLGEANSWEWLNNPFGTHRLFGGCRDVGGLSRVYYYPSDDHNGSRRFRPLIVSPSRA